jgi:hypothetical protein
MTVVAKKREKGQLKRDWVILFGRPLRPRFATERFTNYGVGDRICLRSDSSMLNAVCYWTRVKISAPDPHKSPYFPRGGSVKIPHPATFNSPIVTQTAIQPQGRPRQDRIHPHKDLGRKTKYGIENVKIERHKRKTLF